MAFVKLMECMRKAELTKNNLWHLALKYGFMYGHLHGASTLPFRKFAFLIM